MARTSKKTATKKAPSVEVTALILSLHEKFDTKVDGIEKKIDNINTSIDQKFKGHNDFHINYEKKINKIMYSSILVCGSITVLSVVNRLDLIPVIVTTIKNWLVFLF